MSKKSGKKKKLGRPKGSKSRRVARLTATAVRSFSELFLQDGYDGAEASPPVHDEWWEEFCQNYPRVAIAAPRGHAKSTALTGAYTLANICLRYKRYVVIVADTEDTAIEFLGFIRDQLRDNQDLKDAFGIDRLTKDGETSCVVRFKEKDENGNRFARIRVKGAGQKVRGMLWKGTRPDLIMIDDLENDEAVESKERREKLKTWISKALFPARSKKRGQIRWVGTILHNDSALSERFQDSTWRTKLYKAHAAFDDFSDLLWPEMWSEKDLRTERQTYIDSGDPEGYSQEYLNDPSDIQNPFFRDDDFIPMDEIDKQRPKIYYVGCDFALSDKRYSDFTVLTVGGYDADGTLHIVDERSIRTDDTAVVINELFSIRAKWKPDMFIFEGGTIANAIMPVFKLEMRNRNAWTRVHNYPPIGDKKLRAASIQQRMRSGGVRHDFDAPWFEEHRFELRKFPKGKKKDKVDAIAWLGRGVDDFMEAPTDEEEAESHWDDEYNDTMSEHDEVSITGYG